MALNTSGRTLLPAASRLSVELISLIISFVYQNPNRTRVDPRFSSFATVSRQWKGLVEEIIFKKIGIDVAEFATFSRYLSGTSKYRRRFLKTVNIKLENINALEGQLDFKQDPMEEYSPHPSLDEYGRRMAAAVRDLWEEFHSWGDDLRIQRFYISACPHPLTAKPSEIESSHLLARIPYIRFSDYLEPGYQFPTLLCIRDFFISSEESRVSPSSVIGLVTTMRDLDSIDVNLDDHEKKDLSWRRKIREDLADAFEKQNAIQNKIKLAYLSIEYDANYDERREVWNLTSNAGDRLSRSLRTFSTTLTELYLTGTHFSPELFWPVGKDEHAPEWPYLKSVIIKASQETADGKCLLLAPDERFPFSSFDAPLEVTDPEFLEDNIDDNPHLQVEHDMGIYPHYEFRVRPDGNFLSQYAMAIARAAQKIPKLEVLSFQVLKDFNALQASFGFNYIGNREDSSPRADWFFQCGHGQLFGWEQPDEASSFWRERCGGGLEEGVITEEWDSDSKKFYRRRLRGGRQADTKSMMEQLPERMDLC
ncbi:hypothetical protein EJ08DRAFT_666618 [Tothia fuscella]|uniref:F-box domain-containing protein n=1 Tax=Tothia fuscella TaxID=1048955 RepID=A0A9P4NE43_9PEZI|nr:hypothetical protein EJ08DRAFT_666618 [Tothia fuscella]